MEGGGQNKPFSQIFQLICEESGEKVEAPWKSAETGKIIGVIILFLLLKTAGRCQLLIVLPQSRTDRAKFLGSDGIPRCYRERMAGKILTLATRLL